MELDLCESVSWGIKTHFTISMISGSNTHFFANMLTCPTHCSTQGFQFELQCRNMLVLMFFRLCYDPCVYHITVCNAVLFPLKPETLLLTLRNVFHSVAGCVHISMSVPEWLWSQYTLWFRHNNISWAAAENHVLTISALTQSCASLWCWSICPGAPDCYTRDWSYRNFLLFALQHHLFKIIYWSVENSGMGEAVSNVHPLACFSLCKVFGLEKCGPESAGGLMPVQQGGQTIVIILHILCLHLLEHGSSSCIRRMELSDPTSCGQMS